MKSLSKFIGIHYHSDMINPSKYTDGAGQAELERFRPGLDLFELLLLFLPVGDVHIEFVALRGD